MSRVLRIEVGSINELVKVRRNDRWGKRLLAEESGGFYVSKCEVRMVDGN
jgi:hypothetical protein